jgi:hypothetical protein
MTATTSKLGADMLNVPRELLQDLIDDVADYAVSRTFKDRETTWRSDLLKRADELLARQPAAIDNKAAGYTEPFDVDELKRGGVMRVFAAHETDHDIPVYLTTPLEKESNQPVEPKVTITRQQFDAMRVALEVIAVGDSKTPSDTAAHGLVASGFWTDALETENSNSRAASTSANVAQRDALSAVAGDIASMSADELRAEHESHRHGDIAVALRELSANVGQQPIPQALEDQSDGAWAAFEKSTNADMTNRDDLWPVWQEAWEAARSANVAQGAEADTQAAVDFYASNPSAALFDFQKRIAAPPAQTALTDDARDAARYRWLREYFVTIDMTYPKQNYRLAALDEFIDAALTAAQSASGDKS